MPSAELQRWVATSGTTSHALEVGHEFLAHSCSVCKNPPPAFVIVGFDDKSPSNLLLEATQAFSQSRICLAVDVANLLSLDMETLDRTRVGLLLDNVSAQTPLDQIASQAVEAVRFSPGFILDATTQLRSACILAAMLALVRDLGICTLGGELIDTASSLTFELQFDYVPEECTRQSDRSAAVKRVASRTDFPGRALT